MKLNEILRTLRLRKKLSLQSMADELEISYSTYQGYEGNDDGKIQLSTLEQIAKVHGITVVELLAYEDGNSSSYIFEPKSLYNGKNPNVIKIIVELDGVEETLKTWFIRLEKLNAAI